MKLIFKLLILFIGINAQEDSTKIDLIVRPLNSKVRVFEHEMFKKIIEFHNKKNQHKFSINLVVEPDFNNIRPLMLSGKYNRDNVCSISSFTISNLENFEYSAPYFPVRNTFISLSDFKYSNKKVRCGFNNNPYTSKIINSIRAKYTFDFVEYNTSELFAQLKRGEIDCYFADSYLAYFNDELKVLEYVSEDTEYLGIIFPKGSNLKKKLNNTIKYFIKSSTYYSMLRNYLGKDVSQYVKLTLTAKK